MSQKRMKFEKQNETKWKRINSFKISKSLKIRNVVSDQNFGQGDDQKSKTIEKRCGIMSETILKFLRYPRYKNANRNVEIKIQW